MFDADTGSNGTDPASSATRLSRYKMGTGNLRPAHTPKKIRTSDLCREPFVEFRQGSGVVDPSNGMGRRACHPNILPLRERSGYPVLAK